MEKVNVMREPTWSYTKLNYSKKAPGLNEKKDYKNFESSNDENKSLDEIFSEKNYGLSKAFLDENKKFNNLDIYRDIDGEKDLEFIKMYEKIGYKLIFIDNYKDFPESEILKILEGKTSAVSGSSGVGKSTFLSNLVDHEIEIGSISEKSKRGKNTTRHIEIFNLGKNTNIFDTPGFDSFDIDFIDDEKDLKYCFREFDNNSCKFNNCNHINEPKCKVKDDLSKNMIEKTRYENYITLFEEIKKRRQTW